MLPVCPAAATFRSTIIIRWRGENRRRDVSTYQVVYSCAGCCCCYRRDGAAARVSTGCRDRDVSMAFNFYGTPCLFGCGCCGRRTVHTRRCWKIWRIKLPLAASLPGIIMKKSQRQEFEKETPLSVYRPAPYVDQQQQQQPKVFLLLPKAPSFYNCRVGGHGKCSLSRCYCLMLFQCAHHQVFILFFSFETPSFHLFLSCRTAAVDRLARDWPPPSAVQNTRRAKMWRRRRRRREKQRCCRARNGTAGRAIIPRQLEEAGKKEEGNDLAALCCSSSYMKRRTVSTITANLLQEIRTSPLGFHTIGRHEPIDQY